MNPFTIHLAPSTLAVKTDKLKSADMEIMRTSTNDTHDIEHDEGVSVTFRQSMKSSKHSAKHLRKLELAKGLQPDQRPESRPKSPKKKRNESSSVNSKNSREPETQDNETESDNDSKDSRLVKILSRREIQQQNMREYTNNNNAMNFHKVFFCCAFFPDFVQCLSLYFFSPF
jgi:chaperonin GroEL (HSP60 family)